MKKRKKIILEKVIALLFATTALSAQTIRGTFQGEIAGNVFFLHIEAKDGIVKGFYKYRTDSIVAPLKGKIDQEGNFTLNGSDKPFPAFSGRLQNLTVKGNFTASKNAAPQPFYAVNFDGTFLIDESKSVGVGRNSRFSSISFYLVDEGYRLSNSTPINFKTGIITTHEQPDGSIYLLCEPLNAKMFVSDSSMIVDTSNGLPSLALSADDYSGKVVFTLIYRDNSPEAEESNYPAVEIKLNDNWYIKRKSRDDSEKTVKKWETTRLRHKPYIKITDRTEAQKMLGSQMKIFEHQNEYEPVAFTTFEITFKDGVKKKLNDAEFGSFIAYYPELNVLHLEEYGLFDLNDSKNEHVENPDYSILSPDKQLMINTSYYKNGCPFLKKWNNTKKKYEFACDLHDVIHYENGYESWFCSTKDWFWISNNKALFTTDSGDPRFEEIYEIEFIEK